MPPLFAIKGGNRLVELLENYTALRLRMKKLLKTFYYLAPSSTKRENSAENSKGD